MRLCFQVHFFADAHMHLEEVVVMAVIGSGHEVLFHSSCSQPWALGESQARCVVHTFQHTFRTIEYYQYFAPRYVNKLKVIKATKVNNIFKPHRLSSEVHVELSHF